MSTTFDFSNHLGYFRAHFSSRGLTRLQLLSRTPEPCATTQIPTLARATQQWFQNYIAGHSPQCPPLDLENLPRFFRRVLEETAKIPLGETRTYKELATCAGSPSAMRAVGQAMAKNPIPLIIPCHRVLPTAGETRLGSYSLAEGPALKAALLNFEKQHQREYVPLLGYDWAIGSRHLLKTSLGTQLATLKKYRMNLKPPIPVFDYLVRAIIGQQVHPKAANTIHQRFFDVFSKDGVFDSRRIHKSSAKNLAACGLSPQKMKYIQALAKAADAGTLPTYSELLLMSDEAIINTLTAFNGVGRWTVQMLLIFFLGRPDVWPVDDLGIQKSLARLLKKRAIPSKKQMENLGRSFAPYRSLASLYLWKLHS